MPFLIIFSGSVCAMDLDVVSTHEESAHEKNAKLVPALNFGSDLSLEHIKAAAVGASVQSPHSSRNEEDTLESKMAELLEKEKQEKRFKDFLVSKSAIIQTEAERALWRREFAKYEHDKAMGKINDKKESTDPKPRSRSNSLDSLARMTLDERFDEAQMLASIRGGDSPAQRRLSMRGKAPSPLGSPRRDIRRSADQNVRTSQSK